MDFAIKNNVEYIAASISLEVKITVSFGLTSNG